MVKPERLRGGNEVKQSLPNTKRSEINTDRLISFGIIFLGDTDWKIFPN